MGKLIKLCIFESVEIFLFFESKVCQYIENQNYILAIFGTEWIIYEQFHKN